jgi:hypothetical protein
VCSVQPFVILLHFVSCISYLSCRYVYSIINAMSLGILTICYNSYSTGFFKTTAEGLEPFAPLFYMLTRMDVTLEYVLVHHHHQFRPIRSRREAFGGNTHPVGLHAISVAYLVERLSHVGAMWPNFIAFSQPPIVATAP